ncbi:MAG: TIGR00725 family protein [Candidatus Hydrothermarchaeales archaeon]
MFQIGVIGAGKAEEEEYHIAEQVGEEIAKAGHVLVCGGLGGVMEAAAKGARSQGGLTVGILPGEIKEEANEYIDVRVVTAMSHARNAIITRTADVLITVGGGAGTLSEVALALKIGKPVVMVKDVLPGFALEMESVYLVSSPKEAVELAQNLGKKEVSV